VAIVPLLHGLDCLTDAAWSPDGQQIALLGYRDECANDDPSSYNYQPGMLQIYSAVTGKVAHTLLPDATVLSLPGIPAPPSSVQPATANSDTSKPVLDYTHVIWSPDGKQLALTFVITTWNTAGTIAVPVPAFLGLVLINGDGTNERAALIRETSRQCSALRWDTSTLGSLRLDVQQRYSDLISMPLGTTYSWSSHGQLIPSGSLTSAYGSTSPVGNPDGGGSFTIWQPGIIELFPEPGAPYIYTAYTAFAAWSPDGRYLIDSISLRGIVHPVGEPNPTAAELNQLLGKPSAPTIPIRDRAQQHLYVVLTASATNGGSKLEDVAWSPSGRILAAIPDEAVSNEGSGGAGSPPVTLYDSATGKTVGTLQPPSMTHISANGGSTSPYINSISLLRWSAAGSHLLVYSDQLDAITIWGPSMLPQGA
jgi:hypothetical protein